MGFRRNPDVPQQAFDIGIRDLTIEGFFGSGPWCRDLGLLIRGSVLQGLTLVSWGLYLKAHGQWDLVSKVISKAMIRINLLRLYGTDNPKFCTTDEGP